MSDPTTAVAKGHELKIGEWIVDPERNELRRDGESVRLEPKAIEVLLHLAGRAGRVVTREELLGAVWPGVIVGDDALTQAIIKLRKALRDDAHRPTYIETISKRGYRLIAPLEPEPPGQASGAGARPGRSSRRAAILAGVAALLVLGAILATPRLSQVARMPWPLAEDTRRSASVSAPIVAVLPLTNASDDAKREYFSDGVTDDIIGALGRFSGLRVMSRNAVQPFKGKSPPLQAIRDELQARYIVRGTVRESAGKLRVAVELSDADKGVLLWSDRYEGEGVELFEIQDRIVRNIVATLHVKLTQFEQERAFARPTESLEAHDLVLRARYLLGQIDRGANREARALLARALQLSPQYADILTLLGEAELHRSLFGWVEDPSVTMHHAEELAKRVLASPDTRSHAGAHLLLARFHSNMGRPEEARVHAERSLAANPADSNALYWRGVGLLYVGRIEESVAAMEEARRFDPHLNAASGVNLVMGYYMSGRYNDAIALADILLIRFPRDVSLHALRAASFSQLGDRARAREAAAQVRRYNPYYDVRFAAERFASPEHQEKFRNALREAGL
ncbi:MAG: winged helix-turn-helix domain-containing protein [Usitatibacter sp.]